MTDETRYPARYFDGKTARPQNVTIGLTAEGIAIFRETGVLLATWSAGNIVLAQRPRAGEAVTIGLDGSTARLITEEHRVLEDLKSVAPDATRTFRTNRRTVARIAFWAASACAAAAAILLVLIPLLSEQFAARTPDSVKRKIGEAALKQMVELLPRLPGEDGKVRYCTTPEGVVALWRLADRLLAGNSDVPDIRLIVVNANLVNAFALPGGIVVLTDGLLKAATSPEEIAGVLAHEIGHVVHDHPTQAIFRTTTVSLMISAIIGDVTGGVLITAVAEWALNSAYSRNAERESDEYSVSRLNAAGIDGNGLVRFFERLQSKGGEDSEKGLSRLLSTHPPTPERMNYIRSNATADGKAMTVQEWTDLKRACLQTSDHAPGG